MNRILVVLAAASLSIALPCFAALPPGVTATPAPYSPSTAAAVGTVIYYEVTPANSPWDRIWGTDIYTIDSALAKSAAHVGATIGVKSYVKVTILAGQASYANTTRNGISSESWGSYWRSYSIENLGPVPVVDFAVTGQPQNLILFSGETGDFTVTVSGAGHTFQWYRGPKGDTSNPAANGSGATLTVTAPASSPESYWVRVTNPSGSVDSNAATVTTAPPKGPGLVDVRFNRQSPTNAGGAVVYEDGRVLQVRFSTLYLHSSEGAVLQSVTNFPNATLRDGFIDSRGKLIVFGDGYFTRLDPDTLVQDPAFTPVTAAVSSSKRLDDAVEIQGIGYLLATRDGSINGITASSPYTLVGYDGVYDPDYVAEIPTDGFLNNGRRRDLDVLPDGNILITGGTNFVGGLERTHQDIIFPGGTRYLGFNSATLYWFCEPQEDGKIVYVIRDNVAGFEVGRLNADGSEDTVFNANVPAFTNGPIEDLVIEANGKILVAGGFENVGGNTVDGFTRLLPDGSIDPTFVGTLGYRAFGVSLDIESAIYDPRGYAYFTPDTTTVNFHNGQTGMVRIFLDDNDLTLYQQPLDQRVAIGSPFVISARATGTSAVSYEWFKNGTPLPGEVSSRITRESFSLADVGGYSVRVTNGSGFVTSRTATLTPVGSPVFRKVTAPTSGGLDRSATFVADVAGDPTITYTWKNGTITVFESTSPSFTMDDLTVAESGTYTVTATNSLGFATSTPFSFVVTKFLGGMVPDLVLDTTGITPYNHILLPDDSLVIMGLAVRPNGDPAAGNTLKHLLPDGTEAQDAWKNFAVSSDQAIGIFYHYRAAISKDQSKIWLTVRGAVIQNPFSYGLVRLNIDGTVDTVYPTASGSVDEIYGIGTRHDGKTIFVGRFGDWQGTTRVGIAVLKADGTLDPMTFPQVVGHQRDVYIYPDDSFLLAGNIRITGTGSEDVKIAKFGADGVLDPSFTPPLLNGNIFSIGVQSSGKIIIGGTFTSLSADGKTYNYVARLNPDGSVDSTFDSTNSPNSWVEKVHVQANDSIAVGGEFTSYPGGGNGVPGSKLQLLLPDGSVDTRFQPVSSGLSGRVMNIDSTSDGRLYVSGYFVNYDGVSVPRLVVLETSGSAAPNQAFQDYLATSGVPENMRGANDDPDGDGVPNLIEFAYGSQPAQGGSAVQLHFSNGTTTGASINALAAAANLEPTQEYYTTVIRLPKNPGGVTLGVESTVNFPNFGDNSSSMLPFGPPVDDGNFVLQPYYHTESMTSAPRAFWRISAQ